MVEQETQDEKQMIQIRIPKDDEQQQGVLVKMIMKNMHEVDTINQCFRCTLAVKLEWFGQPSWKPELKPLDAIEYTPLSEARKYDPCTDRSTYKVSIQGTFLEQLELHAFPFDIQKLHVQFELPNGSGEDSSSRGSGTTLKLQEGCHREGEEEDWQRKALYFIRNRNSTVDMASFYVQDAWEIPDPNHQIIMLQGQARPITHASPATLCAFVLLRRKCEFYVWNIMMPSSIMALLSTVSFALDTTELEGRFNLILTLMLTLVAFKNAISGYLPVTSYLTYLDKYVIGCLGYLVMVCMMNMSVCLWIPSANAIMAWIAVGLWGAAHAGTMLLLKKERHRTVKHLEESDTVDGLYDRVIEVEPFVHPPNLHDAPM